MSIEKKMYEPNVSNINIPAITSIGTPQLQLRSSSINVFENNTLSCIVCNKNIFVKIDEHKCKFRILDTISNLVITGNCA